SAVTSYGWPLAIRSQRTSANYTDVYDFANPTSGAFAPRNAWLGRAYVLIEKDDAGRIRRDMFFPEHIVGCAVAVFAAWLGARLLWLLIARFGPPQLRTRRLRFAIPLLAAALAAVAITALS